ncbi:MAG: 2-C-methyl-D-erythritol 4-phosphate cytidylyltransferase, partial [Thermomicrobiales bacterium]|nr:2-C-methyl-D-erythritol 4-phosphate cytidylyltransferase [Thermomicrobiales bacterium]
MSEALPHRTATQASAVVVAAGRGVRLGAPDKALLPLAGRPMLAWSLDALQAAAVDEIVVVAGDHTQAAIAQLLAAGTWPSARRVVAGGARRQDSVLAGLRATDPAAEVVVIHDAARPLASPALFDACIAAAARDGAAIAAVPVADTLKRVVDDRIVATVDRAGLWAAQTPQAFRRQVLLDLFVGSDEATLTDEAARCEAHGVPVAVVDGSPTNLKV